MKIKTRWLLVFLFAPAGNAWAQTLRRPVAAAYTGTGAYSLNHTDVFSLTANQAALAQLKNNSVAVYGERRFLLSELNNYTAVIGLTTRSGNVGLKANFFWFQRLQCNTTWTRICKKIRKQD